MADAVPSGYHTLTPFITANDPQKMVDFIIKAFGGKLLFSQPGASGKPMHAQVQIGDSRVMIGDAMGKDEMKGFIYLYTADVDALYKQAIAAGAKDTMGPPQTMFYGDKFTGVLDPMGGFWGLATHVEDVSPDEMKKRIAAMGGKPC